MFARRLALASVLALLAPACASFGTLQTARTIGKGNLQFAVEPAYVGMGGDGFPRADVSIRYGVSDEFDFGARLGFGGLDLLGKLRLTAPGDGVTVSIAPALGYLQFNGSTGNGSGLATSALRIVNLSIPVLIGVPVGDHELVIGPKLYDSLWIGSGSAGNSSGSGGINLLMGGGTLGFALKAGDGMTFLPEVAVLTPLVGTAGATGTETQSFINTKGGILYQISVGLLFGGK